jgi:hypothetical protein
MRLFRQFLYGVLRSSPIRLSARYTPHLHFLRVFSEKACIVCLFGARRVSQHNLLLPFPSPEKIASLGTQRIPQMNDFCRY